MKPQRILSLVPSLTELLFDLGAGARVIGRTRFCIHPEADVQDVPIIGGTKNPRLEKIRDLKPDLIIANKEENNRDDIEILQKDFEVMVTKIATIEEALFTIHDIGWTLGCQSKAKDYIYSIQEELKKTNDEARLMAAYMIWKDPWMSVGHDTYIHSVMDHFHLENLFSERARYPKTNLIEIAQKKPDVILLSSEPYPFKEKHIQEVANVCKGADIILVNGEWFSWYGSRMLHSFRHLNGFRRYL